MVERPIPVGRGRPGEIERAQARRRRSGAERSGAERSGDRGAHDFHHVRIVLLALVADFRRDCGDVDGRAGERPRAALRSVDERVGRSPCTLTTMPARPPTIPSACGCDPIPRIAAGHDRAAAGFVHRRRDRSESVATTTGPTSAASACRST